jgi:hypothetical protein
MKNKERTMLSNCTDSEPQPEGPFHLPKEARGGVIIVSDGQRERSNSNFKEIDPEEYAELNRLEREFSLKFCTRYYRGDREFSDDKVQRYVALIKRIRLDCEEYEGCDTNRAMKPLTERQLSDDTASTTVAAEIKPGSVQTSPEAAPGHGTSPTQSQRLCGRCKQAPARAGEWNCLECHAVMTRSYRARSSQKLTRLRQLVDLVTPNHSPTRLAFQRKIGKRQRHVVVMQTVDGKSVPLFTGFVTGFHPEGLLSVMQDSGQVVRVALAEVERDPRYGVWWNRPSAKAPKTEVTTED